MSELLRRVNLDSNEPVNFVCYHPLAEQKILKGEHAEPSCLAVEYEYESVLHNICALLGWQGGTLQQVTDGVKKLQDEIRRLRAVIDEIPDLFAVVQAVDDETGEHYEADLDSDPIDKSLLLAKHGVEG